MRRAGLTLLELLVAIAIIAILMALLLPAVQYSREAARRVQCASNLRQIATAVHTYENSHRSFPPGNASSYGYLVAILPQMDRQPLFDRFNYGEYYYNLPSEFPASISKTVMTEYRCPTDDVTREMPLSTSYVGNMGYDVLTLGYNGLFHAENVATNAGSVFRVSDVADGLSHTALAGEILVGDGVRRSRLRTNWATANSFGPGQHEEFCEACLTHQFDTTSSGNAFGDGFRGQPWYGSAPGYTLYTHSLPPNNVSCSNGSSITYGLYTLGSAHAGGAQAVFADGHIELIASSIDRAIWRARGTRAGNEVE